jgi:2-iminobutanoate/2-iminopropanoate deaminase
MPSRTELATNLLQAVHPKPDEAHKMPYAPAVSIVGACNLMFVSGATASALYHHYPHRDEEHVHPHSIEEETRKAMLAIASIRFGVPQRNGRPAYDCMTHLAH